MSVSLLMLGKATMSHPSNAPNMGQSFDANRTTLRAAPEFEAANDRYTGSSDDQARFEQAEHNYDHPEMTPGGSSYSPTVNEVARESLSDGNRKAIREAQSRYEDGRSENGGPAELDFRDQDGEWSDEAKQEYEKWSREGEDERNEGNTPEAAAQFDRDMEQRIKHIRRTRARDAQERER